MFRITLGSVESKFNIQPDDPQLTALRKLTCGITAKCALMGLKTAQYYGYIAGAHLLKNREKDLMAHANKIAEKIAKISRSIDRPCVSQKGTIGGKGGGAEKVEDPKILDYLDSAFKKQTKKVEKIVIRGVKLAERHQFLAAGVVLLLGIALNKKVNRMSRIACKILANSVVNSVIKAAPLGAGLVKAVLNKPVSFCFRWGVSGVVHSMAYGIFKAPSFFFGLMKVGIVLGNFTVVKPLMILGSWGVPSLCNFTVGAVENIAEFAFSLAEVICVDMPIALLNGLVLKPLYNLTIDVVTNVALTVLKWTLIITASGATLNIIAKCVPLSNKNKSE